MAKAYGQFLVFLFLVIKIIRDFVFIQVVFAQHMKDFFFNVGFFTQIQQRTENSVEQRPQLSYDVFCLLNQCPRNCNYENDIYCWYENKPRKICNIIKQAAG